MKKINICFCLIVFCIVLSSQKVNARTYAWIIGLGGTAEKLDVSANKIVQKTTLPGNPNISVSLEEVDDAIAVDANSNLFLITNDYGRVGQWIGAYYLKRLSFIRKFEVESRDPQLQLPKILLPPQGNKFYIAWWNAAKAVDGQNGKVFSVYDKATLNKVEDLASFPIDLYQPWRFSSDGKKIYSINIDANEIKTYDSSSLSLISSISIANLWGTPLFGGGFEYFDNDKLLLAENLKQKEADPNNFWYFIYDLSTKISSTKINVKEVGYGVITPDGKKLVIIESNQVKNAIHIYDLLTGKNLKHLDLTTKYLNIRVLAMSTISPDSSKLYLIGETKSSGATSFLTVDMKRIYDITSVISNFDGSKMIFFDE